MGHSPNLPFSWPLLEKLFLNPRNKKVVFISRSVRDVLIYIKKEFNLFQWLPNHKAKGVNETHKIFENDAVCIYQVTHFSAAISNDHINEISKIIKEFLFNKVQKIEDNNPLHYSNSLQLALAVCIKIIEELSSETDVRLYTWLKEPGNYYITLYPAEFMDVYELNDIEDETKRVQEKIFSFIKLPLSSPEKLGTTIGLYSDECLMIPGWCNGSNVNFYKLYTENDNLQEVYDEISRSLNLDHLQEFLKCKIFDNSKHISLLKKVLNTIIHSENISFVIPCLDTPFPFETVRFSDFAEDICEYELRKPETP